MPRKITVLRDELGFTHPNGGIYSFFPFDELDKEGKGIFKVGISCRDLNKRTDQYLTYFPMSVTIMAILENPDVPKNTTRLKHYQKIEKYIFDFIVEEGGFRIRSKGLIKKEGDTEWFYTYPEIISEAFESAYNKFGASKYEIFDPTEELKDVRKKLKEPHYHGKIIYPLIDPDWAVYPDKKKTKKKPKKSKYDREQDSAYKP